MRPLLHRLCLLLALISFGFVPSLAAAGSRNSVAPVHRQKGQNYKPVGSAGFGFVSVVDNAHSVIAEAFHNGAPAFPNGSVLHNEWSNASGGCGAGAFKVCGFNFVTQKGKYETDSPIFSLPDVSTPATRYSDLVDMYTEFDVTLAAAPGTLPDFNVLSEFFSSENGMVCSKWNGKFPKPECIGTRTVEIGFFPHISELGRTYFNSVPPICGGSFADRYGKVWNVHKDGTATDHTGFIMAVPADGADYLKGILDWKAYFVFLQSCGAIASTEYVNGVSLGVESYANEHTMRINWMSTYKYP